MEKNPTPGEILVMAGAGVALIFSFLPFYKVEILNTSDSTTAWGAGLFPVATLIPIFAVIAARTPAERPAAVEALCADDPTLKTEVRSLLAHHEEAEGCLEMPSAMGAGPTMT